MLIKLTMRAGKDQYRPVLINAKMIESVHPVDNAEWKCNLFTSPDPDSPYQILESFEEIERLVNGAATLPKQSESTPDGWIKWNEAYCPLLPDQIVEVRSSTGATHTAPARKFDWTRSKPHNYIVSYRVKQTLLCACEQPWNGGDCPIDPEETVLIRCRDGSVITGDASEFEWGHDNADGDIVGFRVL